MEIPWDERAGVYDSPEEDSPDESIDANLVSIGKVVLIALPFLAGGLWAFEKNIPYHKQDGLRNLNPPAITEPASTNLSYNSSFTPVRFADSGLDKKISDI
jgi:hypothetical protein